MASSSLINPAIPVMGQSIDAAVLERLPLASPNPLFLLSLSSGSFTDNQYTFTYHRPMRDGRDKLTERLFWDNSSSLKPCGTASTLAFRRTDVLNNCFVSVSETHVGKPENDQALLDAIALALRHNLLR